MPSPKAPLSPRPCSNGIRPQIKQDITYLGHRCHLFPYHPPALCELPHLREKKRSVSRTPRTVPQAPAVVLGAWDEGAEQRLLASHFHSKPPSPAL